MKLDPFSFYLDFNLKSFLMVSEILLTCVVFGFVFWLHLSPPVTFPRNQVRPARVPWVKPEIVWWSSKWRLAGRGPRILSRKDPHDTASERFGRWVPWRTSARNFFKVWKLQGQRCPCKQYLGRCGEGLIFLKREMTIINLVQIWWFDTLGIVLKPASNWKSLRKKLCLIPWDYTQEKRLGQCRLNCKHLTRLFSWISEGMDVHHLLLHRAWMLMISSNSWVKVKQKLSRRIWCLDQLLGELVTISWQFFGEQKGLPDQKHSETLAISPTAILRLRKEFLQRIPDLQLQASWFHISIPENQQNPLFQVP